MICPGCGALVPEDANNCPYCRLPLTNDQGAGADPSARWCMSCGSPIPGGANACPVCGLPVEGAFDEAEGARFSVGTVMPQTEDEADSTGFMSAIPPTPNGSERDETPREKQRRMRLILLAVVASLVVVGGTALYITRPWDPNAYTIHAMEDADTSMEGFPGEVTHLTSQDRTQENERLAVFDEAEQFMDSVDARLQQLASELQESHDKIEAYLSRGYLLDEGADTATVVAISDELAQTCAKLDSYDLTDTDLEGRRDELVVIAGYLDGAANVLGEAWSLTNRESGNPNAVFEVRAELEGDLGTRGYDEWLRLYQNAFDVYQN